MEGGGEKKRGTVPKRTEGRAKKGRPVSSNKQKKLPKNSCGGGFMNAHRGDTTYSTWVIKSWNALYVKSESTTKRGKGEKRGKKQQMPISEKYAGKGES